MKVERRLLVVTGPMRSGTTLLGNMLHGGAKHRHRNLSFLPDTHTELRDITAFAAGETGQSSPLMNPSLPAEFFELWQLKAREVLPSFEAKALSLAPSPAPGVYGVKLTCLLPELQALIKTTSIAPKYLVMHRDPRDIFASALKRYGDIEEGPYLAFMNAAFTVDYEAISSWESVLPVSYERLVAEPRETLSSILRFVGLDPAGYDWQSLRAGLMTNSSFQDIGPNDAVSGVGLRPSVGRYRSLEKFHLDALAEVFAFGRQPSMRTRVQLHEEFFPRVIEVADRYGYRMDGLRRILRQRSWIIMPVVRKIRRLKSKRA